LLWSLKRKRRQTRWRLCQRALAYASGSKAKAHRLRLDCQL